ncbi:MAG: sigma-70 family RNA polymerase sigma factor [Thermoanaerobaculia bacterium]|nr:sigma-70 family RNA polymerase sigma factor [Thermoanaerobaculia bacterium]
MQSTLVAAVETIDRFRGDGALGAWLISICRFQVASYHRHRRVRDRWAADGPVDLDRVESDESLSSELESRELRATVHGTLETLSSRYRQILQWKYLDDLPVKAIAERLEVSPKAAESLLTRAREAFRRVYDPERLP